MVALTPIEALQGIFILIYLLFTAILGIKIILKFFKYKVRELILVGISLLGLVSIYSVDAIAFIIRILFDAILDERFYLFSLIFIPVLQITWMIAFTDFVYKEKQKIIMILIIIEGIIFEIILIYYSIVDFSVLGSLGPGVYMTWTLLVMIFAIFSIGLFLITGLVFAKEALKSDNKEMCLKGKFLMSAFIFYAIGTFIDLIHFNEVTSILPRIILIIAAFLFYIGFTLPEKIKDFFFKEHIS